MDSVTCGTVLDFPSSILDWHHDRISHNRTFEGSISSSDSDLDCTVLDYVYLDCVL